MTASEQGQPPLTSAGGSLRVRMLLSASLVLICFLGVMGLVLDRANTQTAEQRVAERLQLQVYAFLAATEERIEGEEFTLELPRELQEPLFNRMGTGLYGLAYFENSAEIWRSQSATDLTLTEAERTLLLQDAKPGAPAFGRLAANAQHDVLYYLAYPVIWNFGSAYAGFQFIVMEDSGPFNNEVQAFRANLWGWLVGGVLVLVGIQAAIMYWGLLPLARLESDLKAIEDGSETYLGGDYPREINGVTEHFNQLLATERLQREQYRTTLADLAHSLKTPLAILKTEAQSAETTGPDTKLSNTLAEQVDRMNEIVSYQLERAVSSASSLVRMQTDVEPVMVKLIDALRRVYVERQLVIETAINAVQFHGDQRDLMEMAGNLLDNACKYCRSTVRVSVHDEDGLVLVVEDDGNGIAAEDRQKVLQRGARLDTRESGQGIGLAVVAEIVARYGGQISIDVSPLGGTRVSVRFT